MIKYVLFSWVSLLILSTASIYAHSYVAQSEKSVSMVRN